MSTIDSAHAPGMPTTTVSTSDQQRPIALMLGSFFGRGVCRVRLNLCAALITRGYKVDLLVVSGEGEMRDDVPKGVRVIDLQASRALKAIPKIAKYIRREQPIAIISAEDHLNVATLIARKLSRRAPPISVSSHVLHHIDAGKPFWTKRYWTRFALRLIYPWATSRIAVSSGMADTMAEVTGLQRNNIDTVFNAIVTEDINKRAQEACPHPWLEDQEHPVVLGVGRLTDIKDFPTLIRAFAKVHESHKARLIILGDGHRERELRELVHQIGLDDVVYFTGYVDNPFTFLSRASLFVLSSRNEGLPGVLIQAMACGCPVVSTDCPHGPREILDDGRFGPLVPVGNVAALSKTMAEVLDHPPDPSTLKDRAALFEVNHIIDEYRKRLGF
ncbi:Glycosyltransferase involved in cell wall bisynthesis [Sulfitobacter litoralis]|uniref:Glycosyltransferase involved in cell wall bisynthesis n=1 Tax=Sulfitobacter litoralis TaxID=335975 RepID=A0ABY0SUK7_9RHOB|nr:glycosyltransferase [Sulfitobacter litoralis]SDP62391.1 Glycosyltransferase involved in cell wall bisynthesis [Sulfitobacter litoralis]